MISRRRFMQGASVAVLGLLAGCGRPPEQARAPARLPRVGYLLPYGADHPLVVAFRQGLAEYGYVDGGNVIVDARFADGQPERVPALATDLVGLPVDILVTVTSPAAQAARAATATIPIVMATSADAVGEGLVQSLSRPGGNVTGSTLMSSPLSGKRLELLREVVPDVRRVGVLGDLSNPTVAIQLKELDAAAPTLGLVLQPTNVGTADDIDPAFRFIGQAHSDAVVVLLDPVMSSLTARTVERAVERRLPTIYAVASLAEEGALLAYGPSHSELNRRAAYFVDRILHGARPADLPVEQPTRFDFAINLQTAQALGLTIPPHVLLQATEIIQ